MIDLSNLHKNDVNRKKILHKLNNDNIDAANKEAKKLAKNEHYPTLGASDAHYWKFVGDCFSLIDCEKDIDSVLKTIKKGKVEAGGKGTSNILLSKYLVEKNILKKFD